MIHSENVEVLRQATFFLGGVAGRVWASELAGGVWPSWLLGAPKALIRHDFRLHLPVRD
jgi:hypothetical protein